MLLYSGTVHPTAYMPVTLSHLVTLDVILLDPLLPTNSVKYSNILLGISCIGYHKNNSHQKYK